MTGENVTATILLSIVFGTGIVIAVSMAWLQYRTRMRALDVLRIYAERGDEPPASVTEALAAVGSGHQPSRAPGMGAAPVPTRANHMAHVAANFIALLGSAAVAWWQLPATGEPRALMIFAVTAAIFFAMATAARLVSAFTTPPMPHFENDMAHVAANTVGVLGALGMIWWRMPREGEPGALVIWLLVAAIFFAAMLVSRLVTVFATPSGGRPRDAR